MEMETETAAIAEVQVMVEGVILIRIIPTVIIMVMMRIGLAAMLVIYLPAKLL
jgi:hypothetical protein